MRISHLLGTLSIAFLILACKSGSSDPEFLAKYTGNYLYTADELIKVHAEDQKLLIDWRGAENIAPMKVGNDTYYVKHMNTKIRFMEHPDTRKEYLVFVPKHKDSALTFTYVKVADTFKTPSQYFDEGNYAKAMEGYLNIQKNDSLNPIIEEWKINRKGYRYLQKDEVENAVALFELNMALYPNSANVYDSYAEGMLRKGDTATAIANYQKVLSMDSGSRNAKRRLKRLQKGEEE